MKQKYLVVNEGSTTLQAAFPRKFCRLRSRICYGKEHEAEGEPEACIAFEREKRMKRPTYHLRGTDHDSAH